MNKRDDGRRLAFGASLILGFVMAAGCANDQITAGSVRRDMSPELSTLAMTRQQQKNTNARAIDTTWRQIGDDLDKLFFFNRPLRLNEYRIP